MWPQANSVHFEANSKDFWILESYFSGWVLKSSYDQIGNRIRSDLGKWDRQFVYTANNVNQYTQRTVPAEFPVFGTAHTGATVEVNGSLADRYAAYYSAVVALTNSVEAQYKKVTVEAVYNPPGTNNDYYMGSTGRYFVAKTPEAFTHDADGNLTSDGRFNYEWNAENRLVKATTQLAGLPSNVPKVKLKMDYDQQGRRVSQSRSLHDGTAWVWQESRGFIYDGWNLVGETRGTASGTTTNWYVWGLDLSGSIQGAGGVGGMLAFSVGGLPASASSCTFDGNGNVSELVSTNGTVLAHYEYDPYGNPTAEQGALAGVNPFRFSTKYWDGDTKLAYYGQRYYSPSMGRWLSRDPIGDESFFRLYTRNLPVRQQRQLRRLFYGDEVFQFIHNSPVNAYDPDGCSWIIWGGIGVIAGGVWAICCISHMGDIANQANQTVRGIMSGWPPGYSTGAEGTPADAMQHCIGACVANQNPGACLISAIVRAGINASDSREPNDQANDQTGFGIAGDCAAGCNQALQNGQLTCGGTSPTDPSFPCPPPPATPPPPSSP